MAVDLAQLGFSVDSSGTVTAAKNLDNMTGASKRAETATEKLIRQTDKMSKTLNKYGKAMSVFVTGPVIAASLATIKLAIDAEETANKFDVVFRGSIDRANGSLKELTKTVPLTLSEMKGLAAGIQDMLVPMGLARSRAAEFSVEAVRLAGDLSSFNNVGADEVLRNIASALAGQSEPLRKYGIDVSKARLENLALEKGLIGVGDELDKAAEAQAIFMAITEDSADAIGDAARTVDSTANSLKFLSRDINQLREDVGKELIPAFHDLLSLLRDGLDVVNSMTPETRKLVVQTALWAAAIGPLLILMGSLVNTIKILLPLLVRMGAVFAGSNPFAAAALGLGLLVDVIGDIYIAKLEEAITLTNKFTTSLEKLKTAAGLGGNLIAVSEAIDRDMANREQMAQRLAALQSVANDPSNMGGASGALLQRQLADTRAELEQLDRQIENNIRLRDDYTVQLVELTQAEQAAADAAKGASDAAAADAAAKDAAAKAVKKDAEAFAELKDILDPTAKAMRELAAARALLNRIKGKVDAAEFERLSAALERSQMAFDAFTFDNVREFNASIAAELESSFAYVESLEEMRASAEALGDQLDPVGAQLRELAEAREFVQQAFDQGVINEAEFDKLIDGIDRAADSFDSLGQRIYDVASLLSFAFSTMAQDLEEGSSAQKAFAIAAEAANAVLAIQAILNQGSGDPYSAFARMAAMAAVVASLGIRVASISGGGGNDRTAIDRQASQGAGGVLGDAEAKTESILRASEITAGATSELVGINRGMLHALQNLQAGIEGAVVRLARGDDADFGSLPSVFTPSEFLSGLPVIGKVFDLFGDVFSGIIDKIFGGSAKVIDQGVQIVGGTIDEIFFQAFQTVKSKKHIFASTKIRDSFQEIDEALADQFALILGSIADTVREAALALGLPLDEIEQRIAAFEIATQKISFKDLTAEEQREELLAVFGEIFDDLAGAVVPFIDQFQKVGEGLGETLVRVATSVQVFEQAVEALGLSVDADDPETMAQMAVGLVELTGGVENFIAQFTTFFDKFASDEQKLAFATEQLNSAFDQAGLVIPDTREGMVDLMRSLDASTEAGRVQIATLLRLADVADEYYSLLEDAEDERLKQAEAVAEAARVAADQVQLIAEFAGTSAPSRLAQLKSRFEEAMDAADALGASQREYAMIARSFDLQLKRMAAELIISVLQMSQSLFGQEEETSPGLPEIEEVRQVSNQLFEDWQRALEGLREYTQSLLLDDELTTLTPAEKLAEAQSQFDALLAAARAGDVDAAQALPDAAQALLENARFMFASGEQYQNVFDMVVAALEGIQMPSGIPEFIDEVVNGGGFEPPKEAKTQQELLIEELQRFLQAIELSEALRELAQVLDVSVIQLAEELGIPLDQLVELLGVKLDELTEQTAGALAGAAQLLGANIFELIDALNVNLYDLAVAYGVELGAMSQELVSQLSDLANTLGVSVFELSQRLGIGLDQMAEVFGISVANFEASQFQALAAFSAAMGASINAVADQLSISLGDISDATSLLSQALDLAIADLPEAIQADLGPLLTAIREATTEADARGAIQNLGNYVLDLPDDIGHELIPFLQAIGYAINQSPELSTLQSMNSRLSSIDSNTGGLLGALYSIDSSVDQMHNTLSAIGGFASGGPVSSDGLYQLHKGEFVVNPTASNLAVVNSPNQLSSEELGKIRAVLERTEENQRKFQEESLRASKGIESGITQQAEVMRRRANG